MTGSGRAAGIMLVIGALTLASVACGSVTAVACPPSAQRVGWKVVVVSAACDTSIAWITPAPPRVP